MTLVPGILKDYGKDVAWDAINIILAAPGSGKLIGKIGSKVSEGMGQAGIYVSKIITKATEKNNRLAQVVNHLAKIGKEGVDIGKKIFAAAEQSKFFSLLEKT